MPGLELDMRWSNLACECTWDQSCLFDPDCLYHAPTACTFYAPIEVGKTYRLGRIPIGQGQCKAYFRYGALTQCDIASLYGLTCGLDCSGAWACRYSYVGSYTCDYNPEFPVYCPFHRTWDAYLGIEAYVSTFDDAGTCRVRVSYGLRWVIVDTHVLFGELLGRACSGTSVVTYVGSGYSSVGTLLDEQCHPSLCEEDNCAEPNHDASTVGDQTGEIIGTSFPVTTTTLGACSAASAALAVSYGGTIL